MHTDKEFVRCEADFNTWVKWQRDRMRFLRVRAGEYEIRVDREGRMRAVPKNTRSPNVVVTVVCGPNGVRVFVNLPNDKNEKVRATTFEYEPRFHVERGLYASPVGNVAGVDRDEITAYAATALRYAAREEYERLRSMAEDLDADDPVDVVFKNLTMMPDDLGPQLRASIVALLRGRRDGVKQSTAAGYCTGCTTSLDNTLSYRFGTTVLCAKCMEA
jgi:hypothetical protein